MNTWAQYLSSFRLNKQFWLTFFLDALFVSFLVLSFTFFGNYINAQVQQLSNGQTPEQLQQSLATLNPDQLQSFLGNLKSFLFIFLGGLLLLTAASFLLFTLSQALIWSTLHRKPLQHFWRWCGMVFVMSIVLLLYSLGFLIIKLGMAVLLQIVQVPSQAVQLVSALLTLLFIVSLLLLSFLILTSFPEDYKIWRSLERTFTSLKTKWSSLWRLFLLSCLTLLVISLISWFAGTYLLFSFVEQVKTGVTIVLFLLWVGWMRRYVKSTISA